MEGSMTSKGLSTFENHNTRLLVSLHVGNYYNYCHSFAHIPYIRESYTVSSCYPLTLDGMTTILLF